VALLTKYAGDASFMIPKLTFATVVRQVVQDQYANKTISFLPRFQSAALAALQTAAEDYVTSLMSMAGECAEREYFVTIG
jgi:histone H3/H4